jgi:hypothetical protein
MADLEVGAGALGARVHGHLKAVPPTGWVGAAALAVVILLAWHLWNRDVEDSSDWTDPQQPPTNVDVDLTRISTPTNTQMQPSWNTNALRGRRGGAVAPGAY